MFSNPQKSAYDRALAVATWAVVIAVVVAEGVWSIRHPRPHVRTPWWFIPALLAVGAAWIGFYRYMGSTS